MGRTSVTRRVVLGQASAFVALGVGLGGVVAPMASAAPDDSYCLPERDASAPKPQVAVSLAQMSRLFELRWAGKSDGEPFFRTRVREMAKLKGMTRLDGFVIYPAGRDIVIWGQKDDSQPPIFADDFLIALRAALGKFAVEHNGRRVIYQPAISLDADGKIFRQLRTMDKSKPGWQTAYRDMCSGPMVVRVDGMPRHTRVAQVLVDADYRMKHARHSGYGVAAYIGEHFQRGGLRGRDRYLALAGPRGTIGGFRRFG